MLLLFKALIAGMILGFTFSFLKLPLPAPNVLGGILGIIGVYIGYLIYAYFVIK